jgi:flagellar biosynthesis/type III secretory pathway chaperone
MTNEKQRLAQISHTKAPLLGQLERLEQERQFVIDRLPFFK